MLCETLDFVENFQCIKFQLNYSSDIQVFLIPESIDKSSWNSLK